MCRWRWVFCLFVFRSLSWTCWRKRTQQSTGLSASTRWKTWTIVAYKLRNELLVPGFFNSSVCQRNVSKCFSVVLYLNAYEASAMQDCLLLCNLCRIRGIFTDCIREDMTRHFRASVGIRRFLWITDVLAFLPLRSASPQKPFCGSLTCENITSIYGPPFVLV